MSSSQSRKTPTRASLTRKTTKGPLDEDECVAFSVALMICSADLVSSPLSASATTLSTTSSLQSPLLSSPLIPALEQQQSLSQSASDTDVQDGTEYISKDLAFLLDASIYHPLSSIDVPTAFRKALPGLPKPGQRLRDILAQIESLITKCDFLGAAHLAAIGLTSGMVEPNDSQSIFELLAVRYSCLELSGNLTLAAQEAKGLEDLMSGFYYVEQSATDAEIEAHGGQSRLPKHIMPFSLRVQAVRLQNMGFSDSRRGVAALYDLGSECREHLASPYTQAEDRRLWVERLDELGICVVNALVELGDLDCASRTMEQLKPSADGHISLWASRMILLYLKTGQVSKARLIIDDYDFDDVQKTILLSLIAMSDDQLAEAADNLSQHGSKDQYHDLSVLAKQNLAVAYLYNGNIHGARDIMEQLIKEGHSFQSLTVNLATLYDLTSDNSREVKLALVDQVSRKTKNPRVFTNADFKL